MCVGEGHAHFLFVFKHFLLSVKVHFYILNRKGGYVSPEELA